jgi:hypothetical protein
MNLKRRICAAFLLFLAPVVLIVARLRKTSQNRDASPELLPRPPEVAPDGSATPPALADSRVPGRFLG